MNKENLYKREFASFSGTCPYACLHCYTFNPNYQVKGKNSISKIVSSLEGKIQMLFIFQVIKKIFLNQIKD